VIADLHIHTIYSSYSLYKNNKEVIRQLKTQFGKKSLYNGNVPALGKIIPDGLSSPEEVVRQAENQGLGAIAITDHDTTVGNHITQELAKSERILVIPAVEISTRDGHVLAYGVKENLPSHMAAKQTVDLIHKLGGVAVAAHPFAPSKYAPAFFPKKEIIRLDEKLIRGINFDGIEIAGGLKKNQDYWIKVAEELNLAKLGGSDAHTPASIGSAVTKFPSSCKTIEDLLNAIKKRQTSVITRKNFSLITLKTTLEYIYKSTIGRFFINYNVPVS